MTKRAYLSYILVVSLTFPAYAEPGDDCKNAGDQATTGMTDVKNSIEGENNLLSNGAKKTLASSDDIPLNAQEFTNVADTVKGNNQALNEVGTKVFNKCMEYCKGKKSELQAKCKDPKHTQCNAQKAALQKGFEGCGEAARIAGIGGDAATQAKAAALESSKIPPASSGGTPQGGPEGPGGRTAERSSGTPGSGKGSGTGSGNGTGSGSGAGGAGSMLGALAGLGAMAALMNQNKKNQQQNNVNVQMQPCPGGMMVPMGQQCPPQIQANGYASPDGVVQANGQIDCTKPYGYRYTNCNGQIASACMTNINIMMSSPVCTQFSARYCNQGYSAPQIYSPYPYPLVAGQVIGNQIVTTPSPAYPVDQVGEGVGQAYCLRALQIGFCTNASNAQCPSCQQLNTLRGTVCQNNPSGCNVISSPTQLQNQLAQCPSSDPLLSVPGAVPTTPGTVPGTTPIAGVIPMTPPNGGNGLPPPVLPATPNAQGIVHLTSAAGGRRAPSSIGEVTSELDASLFVTASQPIVARCQAGQLLHCFR